LTAKPYPARLARERPPYRPGAAKVAVDRDVHQRYHDREIEQLRKKVWQPASREDEIPEVGDYVLYDVGPLSFIVVRTIAKAPGTFPSQFNLACVNGIEKASPDWETAACVGVTASQ
jgi:hypothetical protein